MLLTTIGFMQVHPSQAHPSQAIAAVTHTYGFDPTKRHAALPEDGADKLGSQWLRPSDVLAQ